MSRCVEIELADPLPGDYVAGYRDVWEQDRKDILSGLRQLCCDILRVRDRIPEGRGGLQKLAERLVLGKSYDQVTSLHHYETQTRLLFNDLAAHGMAVWISEMTGPQSFDSTKTFEQYSSWAQKNINLKKQWTDSRGANHEVRLRHKVGQKYLVPSNVVHFVRKMKKFKSELQALCGVKIAFVRKMGWREISIV